MAKKKNSKKAVTVKNPPVEKIETENFTYAESTIAFVRVRAQPNTASAIVTTVPVGTKFQIVSPAVRGWTEVQSFTNPEEKGYIRSRHLRITEG